MKVPISPADVMTWFLNVCEAIAVIWAAVVVIKQVVKDAKTPNALQDERIEAVESKTKLHEQYLSNDKLRLDAMEAELAKKEDKEEAEKEFADLKEGRKVELEALQALLGHAISGNNEHELNSAKGSVDHYINNHLL